MVVIGVAEPDLPKAEPNIDSQRRHDAYEERMGRRIDSIARHCVELVGIFGITGLRQRILVRKTITVKFSLVIYCSHISQIYRRYSEVPFADLFQNARRELSFRRDILPGGPLSLATNYIDRAIVRLWLTDKSKALGRQV